MKLSSVAPAPTKSLWIPWMFVLGFLVVIGANTILIVKSVSTFSGLETDKAYEQGIRYNTTLSAAAANDRLGWHADIAFTQRDAGRRRIEIRLTDRQSDALSDQQLVAVLVRPTNAGLDQRLSLDNLGGGKYGLDFLPSAMGNWDLRLLAAGPAGQWQTSQRIFLK